MRQKKSVGFLTRFLALFFCLPVVGLAANSSAGEEDLKAGMALYEKGEYAGAFARIRQAAEAKNSEGEATLGYFYENGIGTRTDGKQAASWYERAAKQGLAYAQYRLGKMYEEGLDLAKDEVAAAKWYGLAAEQGYVQAQIALGVMQLGDYSGEKTPDSACSLLQEAAKKGDRVAQYYAGWCAEHGMGLSGAAKPAAAQAWYRQSAQQAYAPAMAALGARYLTGRGIPVDEAEGVKWLQMAADKGEARAQAMLGVVYEKGLGVAPNQELAVKWYASAAKQGNADADVILKERKEQEKTATH